MLASCSEDGRDHCFNLIPQQQDQAEHLLVGVAWADSNCNIFKQSADLGSSRPLFH